MLVSKNAHAKLGPKGKGTNAEGKMPDWGGEMGALLQKLTGKGHARKARKTGSLSRGGKFGRRRVRGARESHRRYSQERAKQDKNPQRGFGGGSRNEDTNIHPR